MSSENNDKRQGTISSARFNLLSSMVGGGSLSLPLAFHQTGNLFVAPILLIVTNLLAQQSILFLVKAGIYSTTSNNRDTQNNAIIISNNNRKGSATYENTAKAAFGPSARIFAMALVCACCFFGTVGYAVLLRDMLEPLIDSFVPPPEGVGGGPTLARNAAMIFVVLCISPLTTWKNLTALKDVGAASMVSVLIVGLCVAYRSIECQLGESSNQEHDGDPDANHKFNSSNLRAFPLSGKQLLDAVPLFISSYICHFNVLSIHNEMRCPTSDRVKQWVRTSLWPATLFYYVIGFTGSLYSGCTTSGQVQGNILLDFDEKDPLLFVGRLCLAMTITLAFPMLVIPARDILVRSLVGSKFGRRFIRSKQSNLAEYNDDIPSDDTNNGLTTIEFEPMEISQEQQVGNLEEPLLLVSENRSIQDDMAEEDSDALSSRQAGNENVNKVARTGIALFVFWSAAALASSVKSIDVVWDLLGSSFSIMLAFLIPCGAYLKLSGRKRFQGAVGNDDEGFCVRRWMIARTVAWAMILFFAPLMFISTANAIANAI